MTDQASSHKVHLNDLRIAPRKVRVVVDQIRGKSAQEALNMLRFIEKKAGLPLHTLLFSAVTNATATHKMDADKLYIESVYVDQGRTLKRWTPRAHGRATRIQKKTSHVTLVLGTR
jgi:large subunit ribosomal protein L22